LYKEFQIEKVIEIEVSSSLEASVAVSDVIITATPATSPMIKKEWLKEGTHLSCVGADMPGKEEIDPQIFTDARVVVDDLKQCMHIGEIEIPVKEGYLKTEDILGEIGELVNGTLKGRANDEEITVFDATGTALLDLITAQLAFKKAEEMAIGVTVDL